MFSEELFANFVLGLQSIKSNISLIQYLSVLGNFCLLPHLVCADDFLLKNGVDFLYE